MTKTGMTRRTALVGMAAGLAAPMLAGRAGAQGAPTEITYWGWQGGDDMAVTVVNMFHEAQPNIRVNYVNTANEHYLKIRNAMAAGTGAPDAVDMEYEMFQDMILAGNLADANAYGASDMQGDFPEWTWRQVSKEGTAYGMPWGAGPMCLYYRDDVLQASGLQVPETWDQMAEFCRAMAGATARGTLLNTNQGSWLNGLFWQAGAQAFEIEGTSLSINIDSEPARKVLAFWQGLLDEGVLDTQPVYTQEWFSALDQGLIATYVGAAWNMRRFQANGRDGVGKWRVAQLPNWDAADPRSANNGGSGVAVISSSEKQEAAFEFARFVTANTDTSRVHLNSGLFPVLNATLENSELMSQPIEFLGGQAGREIFARSAQLIKTDYPWSPFQGYVFSQFESRFPAAAASGGSLTGALETIQSDIVQYATDQGFDVRN